MKERVESAEKKVTLHLSVMSSKRIHDIAYDRNQTQSRYVEDLVERDGRVEKLDMEKLRSVLDKVQGHHISLSDAARAILPIFGIEKAGD